MRLPLNDVSAIIVTRGDVDLQPILETLPYKDVHVWDNSKTVFDAMTFGRWICAQRAPGKVYYFQDDDLIFTEHTALMDAHRQGLATLNMPSPWYESVQKTWKPVCRPLGMFGGGALVPRYLARDAFAPYIGRHGVDSLFLELCDLVAGTFMPWHRVDLGFEMLPQASAPDRICRREGHEARREIMLTRVKSLTRK